MLLADADAQRVAATMPAKRRRRSIFGR